MPRVFPSVVSGKPSVYREPFLSMSVVSSCLLFFLKNLADAEGISPRTPVFLTLKQLIAKGSGERKIFQEQERSWWKRQKNSLYRLKGVLFGFASVQRDHTFFGQNNFIRYAENNNCASWEAGFKQVAVKQRANRSKRRKAGKRLRRGFNGSNIC
jgi:hypothetical protein